MKPRSLRTLPFIGLFIAVGLAACHEESAPPAVPGGTPSGSTSVNNGTTPPTPSTPPPTGAANACAAAGGQCVPPSLNACPSGHLGDPITYSCGGAPAICCLPGGANNSGGGGAGGGTAQPLDPNLAGVATAPLAAFAATEAPGMTKDGAPIAGTFQEGQTLEGTFTFQPGKCYTLVAAGAGILQLDLEMQYTTPVPGIAPSIGKSSQQGALASMGGKGNCLHPLSPFPAPAKFIVKATKGGGAAVAQLYSK